MQALSATTLIGDNVTNSSGEDLGKIEEIMLDVDQGRIAYTVVSFGGFLGMGDKYFAVPWKKLKLDTVNKQFIFDVPKERLENAPGFDKNNWPKTPDYNYMSDVYKHYNVEIYW
jgi:sporulation protein YlmC with PRC-barrel domain